MKLIMNFLIFLSYAIFSASGLILIKITVTEKPFCLENLRFILLSPKFLAGMVLYICGFAIWMFIISRYNVNVAYPLVVSLFFIVAGLGSHFILKETFTVQHIIGIAFCLFGIILIGTK